MCTGCGIYSVTFTNPAPAGCRFSVLVTGQWGGLAEPWVQGADLPVLPVEADSKQGCQVMREGAWKEWEGSKSPGERAWLAAALNS